MLSMGTVFHEIVLKKPERTTTLVDIVEEAEPEIPEPELPEDEEETDDGLQYRDSDEEWDTDLEDAGLNLFASQ